MKRSERLAKDGKIEVFIGSLEIAKVITRMEMSASAQHLRYLGTDFDAFYDGNKVCADVYEDELAGELYAII